MFSPGFFSSGSNSNKDTIDDGQGGLESPNSGDAIISIPEVTASEETQGWIQHPSSTSSFVWLDGSDGSESLPSEQKPDSSFPPPLPHLSYGDWIWTWERPYTSPPVGLRPFRKTINIPQEQVVDSMIIDITCDDIFALYINGNVVGSGVHWNTAHRWSIKFEPTNKVVIAVYATNDPVGRAWAGLIAASVLWNSKVYNGDSYYAVKTDGTWKSLDSSPPRGFEQPSYDDSDWNFARVEGRYGADPWVANINLPANVEAVGDRFTGVIGVPDAPEAPRATQGAFQFDQSSKVTSPPLPPAFKPDLAKAQWIWTHEQPYHNPPIGPRRFRKTFVLPTGQFADSLMIDMTADDLHTLYINGKVVGYGMQWHVARRWYITFPRTDEIIIAVYASNDPVGRSYAGLLASAVVWDSTDKLERSFIINTDHSWQYGGVSAWSGAAQPTAGEGDWKAARVQAGFGGGPWGYIRRPTALSAITQGFTGIPGIPDAPYAPQALGGSGTSPNATFL